MKSFILSAAVVLTSISAPATTTLFRVLPGNFADWSVSTLSGRPLAEYPLLTIPAVAQVSRDFGLRAVVVRSVSQPVFATPAANWPILEVGSIALVYMRGEDAGRLAVVIGDMGVIPLAEGIPLESDGSARLEVIVGFDPISSTAVVSWGDQTKSFACPRFSHSSVGVNLTAGRENAWPQSSLDILTLDAEHGGAPLVASEASRAGTIDAGLLSTAIARLKSSVGGSAGQRPASMESPPAQAAALGMAAKESSLDVFTPPSVRLTHASALRATAAKIQR